LAYITKYKPISYVLWSRQSASTGAAANPADKRKHAYNTPRSKPSIGKPATSGAGSTSAQANPTATNTTGLAG